MKLMLKVLILGLSLAFASCAGEGVLFEKVMKIQKSEVLFEKISCETITDFSAAQMDPMRDGEITFRLTKGTDKIALTVGEEFLSIITGAAVKEGFSESEKWPIIQNDDSHLMAASFTEGLLGSSLYSFALNKKSGLAMWSKVQPNFLYVDSPSGFIQYLKCN